MNDYVLEVKGLTKCYKRKRVVNNVNFTVKKGEILGLLGPNGAGKTTTIKMLTGLIKPDEGEVIIEGKALNKEFENVMRKVGAIVETPHLYEMMTGKENIKLSIGMRGGCHQEHLARLIELSGLEKQLSIKVAKYSLGMKQRLALLIAMLMSPSLLILDEPTNGLDPSGIKELRLFLKKLAKDEQCAILISSHALAEMEMLCDKVAIIGRGNVLYEDYLDTIVSNGTTLEDLFLYYTEGQSL